MDGWCDVLYGLGGMVVGGVFSGVFSRIRYCVLVGRVVLRWVGIIVVRWFNWW